MSPRVLAALAIFLGSYLPLSFILLVQDYNVSQATAPVCLPFRTVGCKLPFEHPAIAIGTFAVCLFCFVLTLVALRGIKPKQQIEITDAKYIPADLMNYTLPYVVALMGVGFGETAKVLGEGVFLGWMFWITYKSEQIVLNPVLIVFGWRLYDISYHFVTDTTVAQAKALARIELRAKQVVRQDTFQSVFIVKDQK